MALKAPAASKAFSVAVPLKTVVVTVVAALDNLEERVDPIVQQVMGRDRAQAAEAGVQRGSMRRLIGSQLFRQLEAPE